MIANISSVSYPNRAMASRMSEMTVSISASVVDRPRLKRMDERACMSVSPIALRTCDGAWVTDEQADPLETETVLEIIFRSRSPPWMSKHRLVTCDSI